MLLRNAFVSEPPTRLKRRHLQRSDGSALRAPGSAAATAASQDPSGPRLLSISEWAEKRMRSLERELVDCSIRRGLGISPERIRAGLLQFSTVIPDFHINLEDMKTTQWVSILADMHTTVHKVLVLKMHYPELDLSRALQGNPRILLLSVEQLAESALSVHQLLAGAKNPTRIIQNLPELMEPSVLLSVIITVRKWYFNKRDPLDILENSPDVVTKARENDAPFEPVYTNADGSLMIPSLNYDEKRTDWQAYIDKNYYKQS